MRSGLAIRSPAAWFLRRSGRWSEWYRKAIPMAEVLYEQYLKEQSR